MVLHIQGGIRKGGATTIHTTACRMDMTEEVKTWFYRLHPFQKRTTAIMVIVIEVKNTVWWLVGDDDIGVGRYSIVILAHSTAENIFKEDRNAIESHAINLHARIAKVVTVCVKPRNRSASLKAHIVVARNENLVSVW